MDQTENDKYLLEGDNFNKWYQVEVDKYLKNFEETDNLKPIKMPNGSERTLFVGEEATICLSEVEII